MFQRDLRPLLSFNAAISFLLYPLLSACTSEPSAAAADAQVTTDAAPDDAGALAFDAAVVIPNSSHSAPPNIFDASTGSNVDAEVSGIAPNASTAPNPTGVSDASAPPDASALPQPNDAGQHPDAGEPPDASPTADANQPETPEDAAEPPDAGQPPDAAILDAAEDAALVPVRSFCPLGPYAAAPASGTLVVQTLCTNLTFTEGPVWVAAENSLFFSDFDNGSAETNYNGVIVKYTAASGCSTWLEDTGSNGLALNAAGKLVACLHSDQSVTEFDLETRTPELLAGNYQGDHFSSPNDLALRADGNLYFSDPAWNLGERVQELPQALYRVDPLGQLSQVEVLDNQRPNGVAVSPDGTRLYVALNAEIRQYDLDATGQASNPRLFASAGSDGLAVDCAGNVYVTSGGIRVFTRESSELPSLQVAGSVTNLAFGGPNGTTLFITGGTQLRAVELQIPGLPY